MQFKKYALFWIFLISVVTALFWRTPLSHVGTPLLVILPVGFLFWLLIRERSERKKLKRRPDLQFSNFKRSSQNADSDLQAHSDLVRMCLGDVSAVERLIRYEHSRRLGMTRAQATRAARDRLKYEKQRN